MTRLTRYVVLPALVVKQRGGEVYIGNPAAGTGLECSAGVLGALALLKEPTSLEALSERVRLSLDETREILAPLLDGLFVVPEELVVALSSGPTRSASRSIGEALPFDRIRQEAEAGAIGIVGAPSGVGAGPEGLPSHGPALVRHAFPAFLKAPRPPRSPLLDKWELQTPALGSVQDIDFRRRYAASDLPRVFDVGDVVYETGEGLELYGQRLSFVLERMAAAQLRPFLIGGDHSLTRFAVGALLRHHETIGILHFDAHHDLYKGLPAGALSHANPFAHLLPEPGLAVLQQVGLRSTFEEVEASLRPIHEPKLRYVSALECQTRTPAEVFGALRTDIPYYLSFDIDVLDPVYAPETGMPELGGLSYYQCLQLVDYAARHFNLIGMDVVEVGGSERRTNWAARIGARMLAQGVLGRTRFSTLETYLFERR